MLLRVWLELWIPKWSRPFLSPLLFDRPVTRHKRTIISCIFPVIEQRLAELEYQERNQKDDQNTPEDYVSWHWRHCKQFRNQSDLNVERTASLALPMFFVMTTIPSIDLMNIFLDIFSDSNVMDELRREVESVSQQEDAIWTRRAASKCYKTDSAIRESLRKSLISLRSLEREVMLHDGIHNDQGGWVAPKGSIICLDAWSRHHDPEHYANPNEFDAFRYSRRREDIVSRQTASTVADDAEQLKQLPLTTLSDSYLAFGMGQHAWYVPLHIRWQHETDTNPTVLDASTLTEFLRCCLDTY